MKPKTTSLGINLLLLLTALGLLAPPLLAQTNRPPAALALDGGATGATTAGAALAGLAAPAAALPDLAGLGRLFWQRYGAALEQLGERLLLLLGATQLGGKPLSRWLQPWLSGRLAWNTEATGDAFHQNICALLHWPSVRALRGGLEFLGLRLLPTRESYAAALAAQNTPPLPAPAAKTA